MKLNSSITWYTSVIRILLNIISQSNWDISVMILLKRTRISYHLLSSPVLENEVHGSLMRRRWIFSFQWFENWETDENHDAIGSDRKYVPRTTTRLALVIIEKSIENISRPRAYIYAFTRTRGMEWICVDIPGPELCMHSPSFIQNSSQFSGTKRESRTRIPHTSCTLEHTLVSFLSIYRTRKRACYWIMPANSKPTGQSSKLNMSWKPKTSINYSVIF